MNEHLLPVAPPSTRVSRSRYERQKIARHEAEGLLDSKSRELWVANKKLVLQAETLEGVVDRRTSELRKAKSAAEASNQAKSIFLAKMSHEIRTPLNGVLGTAEALMDTPLSADQRQMTDIIVDSGKMLLALLNDILDISKIESGRLEIDSRPFDVAELFESSLRLNAVKAREKGLEIELNLDVPANTWVLGDPIKLRQVAGNLLSNAIKFTEKGRVDISVRLEKLSDEKSAMIVSVRDTGIGIPAGSQGNLFKPFVQLERNDDKYFEGTGLGLSISSQICNLMQGDLSFRSVEGGGSIFTARIEVGFAAPVPKLKKQDIAETTNLLRDKGWRILIAEDNSTNMFIITSFLKDTGLDLTMVSDGQQALEAFVGGKFDLVLLDIDMPKMNGSEAAAGMRHFEKTNALKPTKLIALTANSMTHQVASYLEQGMDGHLSKPFEKVELLRAIADSLADAPNSRPN